MGKYEYLVKQGWSEEKAKEYVSLMEEGMSPTNAYQHVLGKGEKTAIAKREPLEIEVRSIKPSKPSVVKNIIKETKELGGTIVKEAKEYVPGKIRSVREDLETKRAYRESYRKHGYETASSRGAEAEQRHHKEMIGKEARRIKLEEEREKIALAAEKAARIERAKILTKQKYASRQTRSQVTGTQILGFGQYGNSYGLYTLPKISYGEYAGWITGGTRVSRPGQQPANKSSHHPTQQQSSIFELYHGDATQAYALLGFRVDSKKKVAKTGKKERRYNIFSGTWEEV